MSNFSAIPDLNSRYSYWEEVLGEPRLKQRSLDLGYKCVITKIPTKKVVGGVKIGIDKANNWLKGLKYLETQRALEVFSKSREPNVQYSNVDVQEAVESLKYSWGLTR